MVTASYTANLAAFLTYRPSDGLLLHSLGDLQGGLSSHGLPLCVPPTGHKARFDAMYPGVSYVEMGSNWQAADALASGACAAVLTSRTNFDAWKVQPEYCQFEIAQTLYTAGGAITVTSLTDA